MNSLLLLKAGSGRLLSLSLRSGLEVVGTVSSSLLNINTRTTSRNRLSQNINRRREMSIFQSTFDPKDVKRSEDKCCVSLRLPGFNKSDYGRDGNITMQSLMIISSSGEPVPFGKDLSSSFLGFDWRGCQDTTTFSLTYDLKVSGLTYDPRINKTELLAEYSLLHVGKSSFRMLCRMFTNDNRSVPILRYVTDIVRVDFNTRKPVAWPGWMFEFFQERKVEVATESAERNPSTSKRMKRLDRPANTFVYSVHVAWSDTDENAHCNFASYAKFADDSLRAALKLRDDKQNLMPATPTSNSISNNSQCRHQLGVSIAPTDKFVLYQGDPSLALRGIRKEVQESGVRRLRILFLRECREGDLLHVHIWQVDDVKVKDNVVFVSLEKDDQVICQMVMEYFTGKSKL